MALIRSVKGIHPKWGTNCYFAENATIVGDVEMGNDCSVWFNAVIRGDVNLIRIGNKVNIQDGAVIHCTFEQSETHIGDDVSIGHNAIVHGCTIRDRVLIGMGAIVMDHCVIEENVLIAAGAIVLENAICESGFIYGGVPAKKLKPMDAERFNHTVMRIANNYLKYSSWFK